MMMHYCAGGTEHHAGEENLTQHSRQQRRAIGMRCGAISIPALFLVLGALPVPLVRGPDLHSGEKQKRTRRMGTIKKSRKERGCVYDGRNDPSIPQDDKIVREPQEGNTHYSAIVRL
jgi:hypothetical protein